MIHLPSLTSSVYDAAKWECVLAQAREDLNTLAKAGFDAILVENYGDQPYPKYRLDDAKFLVFNHVITRLIPEVEIPLGINILRNACIQALTLATVAGASFIRCNVWEGAYITDQGLIEGVATQVQQRKTEIRSRVKILADVHVKHSTPLGQFTLGEAAQNALTRGKADAVIVTGRSTGQLIAPSKLKELVTDYQIRPILGSGLTIENIPDVFPFLSGAIVGTAIKKDPTDLTSPLDARKANELAQKWHSKRKTSCSS